MNILYTFLNFNNLTGSELYYYELAKEMVKLGHHVTIASNCSGQIMQKAKEAGIKCIQFSELNFMGEFDIIHASHKPVVDPLLKLGVSCPIVITCHSEILDIEKIPDNHKISHFIGIRQAIYNELPKNKRSLICNPVDSSRFNKEGIIELDYIFFPGTINYLRINPLIDLVQTYGDHYKILCMGSSDYPDVEIKGVEYLKPHWDIEKVIKEVKCVAGIIKGRTYIESMMCGKHYIDYMVDEKGIIEDIKEYKPSEFAMNTLIENFHSNVVAEEIEKLYKELIIKGI